MRPVVAKYDEDPYQMEVFHYTSQVLLAHAVEDLNAVEKHYADQPENEHEDREYIGRKDHL